MHEQRIIIHNHFLVVCLHIKKGFGGEVFGGRYPIADLCDHKSFVVTSDWISFKLKLMAAINPKSTLTLFLIFYAKFKLQKKKNQLTWKSK